LLLRLPPVEDGIMAHLLPEALGQSKNDPGRLVTAAQGSLPTANDQDRNVARRQMCPAKWRTLVAGSGRCQWFAECLSQDAANGPQDADATPDFATRSLPAFAP